MRIRYRNIVRDMNNVIVSGSAALVNNTYRKNKDGNHFGNHTKQEVVERLGKVLWIDENDNMKGIFNSPSRGLVYFDLSQDSFTEVSPSDERLKGTAFQNENLRIHTSFGNTYLFFSELAKTPHLNVLRNAFGQNKGLYQKVLAHTAHDCLRNGASIKCGEFLKQDVLSYILTDISYSSLDCDSAYYRELSDDKNKERFFKSLITEMRKTNPDFGRGCYVDSTPLPGEARDNPFNALSSHGTDGARIKSRLVMVMDIQTNIPLWFEIIPANVLDKSTIESITNDVRSTLDIRIDRYDLDAGYARKELFEMFNRNNSTYTDEQNISREHTVLVRMPAVNGYPHHSLYIQCKPNIYSGRYSFDYEHHTFFGQRVEVNLFGYPEYAFVYVDKTQAESLLRNWRTEHQEEWDSMTDSAQDWYQVKDGYFVLLGNKDQSPRDALIEYRSRVDVEMFFRDSKAYLTILPLAKWNKFTVKGKIFHDIIETIVYRAYRKQTVPSGMTMSGLNVCLDSWECHLKSQTMLELKTPKTQVRETLEKLGYTVPGHIMLSDLSHEILDGIPMSRVPVTMRTRRSPRKEKLQVSPEEKMAAKEKARIDRLIQKADEKKQKAESRADKKRISAENAAKERYDKALKKAERCLQNSRMIQAI